MKTSSALGRVWSGCVVSFLCSFPAWSATAGEYLWIAEPNSVYRVDTETGAATRLAVEATKVVDFDLDAGRGRLWILQASGRVGLHRLDGDPVRSLSLDRGEGGAPDPEAAARTPAGRIEVDPRTGQVHVAWRTGIHYLSREGEVRRVVYLPDAARRLAYDPADRLVWVATEHTVHVFDADGAPVGGFRVEERLRIVDLSLSGAAGTAWLVLDDVDRTANVLREYDRSGGLEFETRLRDLSSVSADGSGGFWAAGAKNILLFSQRDRLECALALRRHLGTPLSIAVDAMHRRLWIATESRLVRLDDACTIDRRFAKTGVPVAAMLFDDTGITPPGPERPE
jgi:hypothetical protein